MYNKIILSLVVLIFFFVSPIGNIKAEEKIKEIDISTSPHKVFFDIQNGRPGDTYIKELNIQNNGTKDFKYLFSNRFLTGSKKIYNELVLTVSDTSGELYNGKLKDFEKLDSRYLKSNTSENLVFSIKIPYELGNEYQGLGCEFQFKFFVEGSIDGTIPPIWVPEADPPKQDPPKENPTSTQPPGDKDPGQGNEPGDEEKPGDSDEQEEVEDPGDNGSSESEEKPIVELPDTDVPGGTDNGTPVVDIPGETVPMGPGDHLPYTATSIYNLLMVGVGLIGSGIGLQIYFKKRKKLNKDV
ncbi:hypothetical protein [Bacillus sp. FJAT-27445]|uniref:hypothetical protein n=1 Tax=Bacillus sp. FJAT-27445 TaxID=1679166 RepID=UPI000743E065|nr:hypothetical protein [Bacillus sp. FJAT-27445]